MKKALLTIACVLMAFAVSAQEDGGKKFVISGTLGIGATSETYSYDGTKHAANATATPSDFDFTIAPKFGYQLNENFQIGAFVGFTHNGSVLLTNDPADVEKVGTETTTSRNVFDLGLYGRMNIVKFNKLTLFGELQLGLGFGSTTRVLDNKITKIETTQRDISNFDFNATVVPGLNYAFSDSFSMDLYFDLFGLGYTMTKETNHMAGATADKDAVTTNHDFGLKCNLKNNSIDDFTRQIKVGFNFHF